MDTWSIFKHYFQLAFSLFGLDVRKARSTGRQIAALCEGVDIDVVLDVGANKGQFIHELVNLTDVSKIYCFEPIQQCFDELEQVVQALEHDVQCFNFALGEVRATTEIQHHLEHQSSSSILSATSYSMEKYSFTSESLPIAIEVETLDSLMRSSKIHLEGVVLLKLDVQGYEDRVLRGAPEVLKEVSIVLLEVCIAPLYESQAKFSELVSLLDEAGFSYKGNVDQIYDGGYKIVYLDALFVREESFIVD